jgi:hypothetical protein
MDYPDHQKPPTQAGRVPAADGHWLTTAAAVTWIAYRGTLPAVHFPSLVTNDLKRSWKPRANPLDFPFTHVELLTEALAAIGAGVRPPAGDKLAADLYADATALMARTSRPPAALVKQLRHDIEVERRKEAEIASAYQELMAAVRGGKIAPRGRPKDYAKDQPTGPRQDIDRKLFGEGHTICLYRDRACPSDETNKHGPIYDEVRFDPIAITTRWPAKPITSEWPWLTLWQVTTLLACGTDSVPAPALHRPAHPWGDAFKAKWGFNLGTEPTARRAFPLRDIRHVLARVNWWRARHHRRRQMLRCPPPPLKPLARASVRATLRRHGKPATELRAELLRDIREELAREAAFSSANTEAHAKILRALSAGSIVAWGYEGNRLRRTMKSGSRQPIHESFFARPDVTIMADNWICSRTESDWCDVRFKLVDVHRVWPEAAPVPSELVETGSIVETEQTAGGELCQSSATAEPVATVTAPSALLPRPKPTQKAVTEWFEGRVANWPDDKPAPSDETDWQAASSYFDDGLRRDEDFRLIRRKVVPSEWQKQGPRKPWGQVKQSAANSAKLRPQN